MHTMVFRFSDASDANHFYERLFWGYAFSTGQNHVTKHVRIVGTSSIRINATKANDYILIAMMAMLYQSFTGTELLRDKGN